MKLIKIIAITVFATFATSSFAYHGNYSKNNNTYCAQNEYCGNYHNSKGYHKGYHR